MAEEKPLTLNELERYHKEILIPSLKENFATKQEIEYLIDVVATKEELHKTKEEILVQMNKRFDSIDRKLEDVKEIKTKLTEAGVLP